MKLIQFPVVQLILTSNLIHANTGKYKSNELKMKELFEL